MVIAVVCPTLSSVSRDHPPTMDHVYTRNISEFINLLIEIENSLNQNIKIIN